MIKNDPLLTKIAGGAQNQITTVEVTSAVNDGIHTLTITYNGASVSVSYTADGSATASEVAGGLEAALDAEPLLGALFVASVSTATITLTGRVPGQSFVASWGTVGAATVTNTQAAAEAGAIPPGRGVIARSTTYPKQCKLPATTDHVLKVINATPTAENSIAYQIAVIADLNFDGVVETYPAVYTSDGSATVQEIVEGLQAALDAQMPANTIAITEDNTKLIFTGELPGLDFHVTATETGSSATWTIANATDLTSPRFLGVAALDRSFEQNASDELEYPGGSAVQVLTSGQIWAELDAGVSPSIGAQVWCRLNATSPEVRGAFRTTQDAADCFLVPSASWASAEVSVQGGKRLGLLAVRPSRFTV
ncbi:MAG: hypothetical protein E6Q97_32120 [Desulfurellales bacterium]|nr:MAG: hypothetical protein E6Q97_32120 [Desulfurellales bacterium]